jgi:hypothetical protein
MSAPSAAARCFAGVRWRRLVGAMASRDPTPGHGSSDHALRNFLIAVIVVLLAVNLYTGFRMSRLTIGIVSVDFVPPTARDADSPPLTTDPTVDPTRMPKPERTNTPKPERTPTPEARSTPKPSPTRSPKPAPTQTLTPKPTATQAAEATNEKGLTLDEYLECVQSYEPDCGSVPE